MINDKMINNNNDDILNEFLKNSPYTDEEKSELTLSIYGLKSKLNKIEVKN